jgi:hypothetical protein
MRPSALPAPDRADGRVHHPYGEITSPCHGEFGVLVVLDFHLVVAVPDGLP